MNWFLIIVLLLALPVITFILSEQYDGMARIYVTVIPISFCGVICAILFAMVSCISHNIGTNVPFMEMDKSTERKEVSTHELANLNAPEKPCFARIEANEQITFGYYDGGKAYYVSTSLDNVSIDYSDEASVDVKEESAEYRVNMKLIHGFWQKHATFQYHLYIPEGTLYEVENTIPATLVAV